MEKTLVVITGPTASGKTELSLELAVHFQTHILSADSRQLYKELKIGVARPPDEYLQKVPHHFIATHSIFHPVSAGQYARECKKKIEELFQEHDILILAGGSGLYIKSVLNGLDAWSEVKTETRNFFNQLKEEKGTEYLRELLFKTSPEWFNAIDNRNPARVQRALEILHDNPGISPPDHSDKKNTSSVFRTLIFVIDEIRSVLYTNIEMRVDKMIEQGLKEEAMQWKNYKHLPVLRTVGYREWYEYEGNPDEYIIEKIKQHTRNYAKKQLTWFRHQFPEAEWIKKTEKDKIQERVHQ